uniref:Metalloendopeptidase n=1 Tax=Suberites domuncula TaxID=55567 RepID=H8WG14_SUBDO|nr:bone morphogenetic protein 1 [Suberites domuncula]
MQPKKKIKCFIVVLGLLCIHNVVRAQTTAAARVKEMDKKNDTDQDEIFEGDLKLPKNFILKHYNLSSIPGGNKESTRNASTQENINKKHNRVDRAAGSEIKLWTNNCVRYQISTHVSMETATLIRRAMNNLEEKTCLRFISGGSGDYIEFTSTESGCFSHMVGRQGGRQQINLGQGCRTFGIITHEIGHAIGFWHEQSRPDRDRFVRVNNENIRDGKERQFMKRKHLKIDYQGSPYDYGSIMHYSSRAFSRPDCTGENCVTLSINNAVEYSHQGSPTLGQRNALSAQDILQINRLYTCPGNGVNGFLMYRVRDGASLPDTDPALNNPDPYVRFTSVDQYGNKHFRQTSVKSGTTNPVWNEWVSVSERSWQFFRVRVWDDDNFFTFGDDQMTMSETYVIDARERRYLRHCENTRCNGYVIFDYKLLTLSRGNLQIKVRFACNLVDTDPIWNNPDPYVRIEAKQSTGAVHTRTTGVISGTINPKWNQWINYGCQRWAYFEIQVWDDDNFLTGADDQMSNKELVFVNSGRYVGVRHNAHGSGYLIYDYNFIVDGNECAPNPCRNQGTCRDGCSSYTCTCRWGYAGTNCEHTAGTLRVTARYARNLPDEDGWWNNSDPYMEFIAIDQNGNSVRKTTSAKGGDQNPNWYESHNFGYRAWKQLRVRVYDDDNNADDPLSNQQTLFLSAQVHSRTVIRHNCHSATPYSTILTIELRDSQLSANLWGLIK